MRVLPSCRCVSPSAWTLAPPQKFIFAQRFRKRDPKDAEEIEYMENLFDALCSALAEPYVKQLFLDSEGIELMIILMK